MKKEELLFCPLGGSGEIGANMNLYAYGKEDNQKWIIVDMGVTFADESIPGIDLIYPDPGFILEKKKRSLRYSTYSRTRRSYWCRLTYMARFKMQNICHTIYGGTYKREI